MRIFALIGLNLLGIFFAFSLLIVIFDEHAGASGQHSPTPLGERLLSIAIFGAITAIIYGGIFAIARQNRKHERQGFPFEPNQKDEV
jgi:hypothetical protein